MQVDVLDARRKELNGAMHATGRAERSLVHARDRLRAGSRGAARCRSSRTRSGATMPARPRASSPASISGSPSTPSARTARASLVVPVIRRRRYARLRRVSRALRRTRRRGARRQADRRRSARRVVHADQPRRHRNRRVGAAPHARAGRDPRDRRDRLSARLLRRANEQSLRLLGVSSVMQITSTYDHRVIQGAQSGEYLRRVDELLQGKDGFYEAIFASLGLQAAAVAASRARAPVGAAAPRAVGRDAARRRGGNGDRLRIPPSRPSGRAPRSARRASRSAIRRSSRRRTA